MNEVGLQKVADIIEQMRRFVDEVYLPDVLAIGSFYKDWFKTGYGEGTGNFLTYGDFPPTGSQDPKTFLVPRGAILNRDLSHIQEVDLSAERDIEEFVSHSWYDYSGGKDTGLHPYKGETRLNYSGPQPPYANLDTSASYSWLKSPRWKGHAMETGPLARVLMLYASGHEPTKELANKALAQLDLPLEAMFSTMGRTAARALECKILADALPAWYDSLMANIRGRRRPHRQSDTLGTFDVAAARAGSRISGGTQRFIGPLDRHRRRQDFKLPGGGAHDVECRPARSCRHRGSV